MGCPLPSGHWTRNVDRNDIRDSMMWGSNLVSGVFQWVVTHLIHRAVVFRTLQLLPAEFIKEGYTL